MTEEQINQRADKLDRSGYHTMWHIARLELRLEALEGKGGDDTREFLHECLIERNKFCMDVQDTPWSNQIRTSADNILIMYDQLMERLKNASK